MTPHQTIASLVAEGARVDGNRVVWATGSAKIFRAHGYAAFVAMGRQFTLANLVCWLAHGPAPTEKHVVDHINRVCSDDRPENLRWATVSENARNVKGRTSIQEACTRGAFNSEVAKAYGAKKRTQRLVAGFGLREVARKMGISGPYLVDMELGRRIFSPEMERRFLNALSALKEGSNCV